MMSSALREAISLREMSWLKRREYKRRESLVKESDRKIREIGKSTLTKEPSFQSKSSKRRNITWGEFYEKQFCELNEDKVTFINGQLIEINNLKNRLSLKTQVGFKVIESYNIFEEDSEIGFLEIKDFLLLLWNDPYAAIQQYGYSEDLILWKRILNEITIMHDEFFIDHKRFCCEILMNNSNFDQLPMYVKQCLLDKNWEDIREILIREKLKDFELFKNTFEPLKIIPLWDFYFPKPIPIEEPSLLTKVIYKTLEKMGTFLKKMNI